MKHTTLLIGLLLAGVFGITGCQEDILDTQPTDRIINEYYWQNDQDALYAVNAVYRLLPAVDYLYLDASSDNAFNQKTWERAYPFGNGSQDATTSFWAADYWQNAYKAIQRVNYLLENVDKVPTLSPELKKRITAEARFLRAFSYNDLSFLYGDVPLVTNTLDLTNGRVARDAKQKVVDFVLAELTEIADALPLSYDKADTGRVTKGAALALKSRVYLQQNRYAEAKTAAKAVMDLGVYSLYADYGKLFTYAAENNAEVIFDKQYIASTYNNNVSRLLSPRTSAGDASIVPLKSLVDAYESKDGLTIDKSPLYNPASPYQNRDPRLMATILTPGATWNGVLFNPAPGSGTADMVGSSQSTSNTGFNFKKYVNLEDLVDNNNNGSINLILIRYADILLTYAESKIETGELDNSVYEAINQVRKRAGMPPVSAGQTQAELRTIVRRERQVELALEGSRFFDIRRWKTAETVLNGPAYGINYMAAGVQKTVLADTRKFNVGRDYLWPLPQREINANPLLTNNPGY